MKEKTHKNGKFFGRKQNVVERKCNQRQVGLSRGTTPELLKR
jgi:hypothetical protein